MRPSGRQAGRIIAGATPGEGVVLARRPQTAKEQSVLGETAVVGIGETDFYRAGQAPLSEFQLACIAVKRAAEDAGVPLEDIDGYVAYSDRQDPIRLSAALGTKQTTFTAQCWGGGGNGTAHAVAIAAAAVEAGYAKHVVAFRSLAQGQFGRFGRARGPLRVTGARAYTSPYGLVTPAQECAMQTRRFMHEYGVTQEALAEISLASYEHAQRNPRAVRYGQPLTREQYHDSRWIVEPFHLFDCCQESDGSAAVVITTAERAADLPRTPAYIKGAAQGMGQRAGATAFTEPQFPTAHYKIVGEELWARSGVGPEDVDVAQVYENFTGPVLIGLVEMGFAPPDGIEEFVSDGNIRWPDGDLPINTSGGNLAEAYIHGFELVTEAVRQILGESTCQVEDAELSLVISGPGYCPGSSVLFSKDRG
jgi:acetyl-CoA acetyltransferase